MKLEHSNLPPFFPSTLQHLLKQMIELHLAHLNTAEPQFCVSNFVEVLVALYKLNPS